MSNPRLTTIRCACPDCASRDWSIEEIRAHPAFPAGQQINRYTLPKVAKRIGHELYYADSRAKGTWTPARRAVAGAVPEPVSDWVFNSDPKAMDVLPVNAPMHYRATDGPQDGGGM